MSKETEEERLREALVSVATYRQECDVDKDTPNADTDWRYIARGMEHIARSALHPPAVSEEPEP